MRGSSPPLATYRVQGLPGLHEILSLKKKSLDSASLTIVRSLPADGGESRQFRPWKWAHMPGYSL